MCGRPWIVKTEVSPACRWIDMHRRRRRCRRHTVESRYTLRRSYTGCLHTGWTLQPRESNQQSSYCCTTRNLCSAIRYDRIRDATLTCARKLTRVSLIYRTELTTNKKLSYRRGTARCVVSVEILPIATQQCRNYLYDKSWTNRSYEVGGLRWADV